MSFFQDWLIPLLEDYGLLIVFLTMMAESACIPIPSEIVVPYGGFLAAQGFTELWMVIVVATVANLIGSSIAYAVGRYGGRALFLRYGRYVLVSPHHLDKAERWFDSHGEVTVFFTRMMPGVRTFISLPAGIARMRVGKFLLYSALGSIVWNAALAYLGYLAGKAAGEDPWGRLQEQFGRYNHFFYIALGVVVVALIALGFWRWRRRRATETAGGAGSSEAATTGSEGNGSAKEDGAAQGVAVEEPPAGRVLPERGPTGVPADQAVADEPGEP
jgi:membrane protein DedA with SNARE-associated domain